MTDLHLVRRLGWLTETVHAVVYFAPEPQEAYLELGLRGYWRGYFASRAAALGTPGPEVVTALFAGFAPGFVTRAVPDVWSLAAPDAVLAARSAGATTALRRLIPAGLDASVEAAAALTRRCVESLPLPGRPMAAAVRGLARPTDPLAALWHDCTVLREFRGDAHLDAVAAAGLAWPEPHLLRSDNDGKLRANRGWDEGTWEDAAERVRGLDPGLYDDVETATDAMAAPAYAALDEDAKRELLHTLQPIATAVVGEIPYPNAMGLPAV